MRIWTSVVGMVVGLAAGGQANDWTQWMGGADRRNAVTPAGWQTGTVPQLKVLWRSKLGSGYASVAVLDGTLATQMTDGDSDYVVLLEARTGAERWRYRIGPKYAGHDGSIDGPLSTPAMDADSVYALGPRGRFLCLARASGKLRWEVNIKSRFQASEPHYGFATSPLLEGQYVILQTGGSGLLRGKSLVALDRSTGAVAWESQSDLTVYSSPTAVSLGGVRQVVVQADKRVYAVSVNDGKLLWEQKVPASSWTPLPLGDDRLFLSTEDRSRVLRVQRSDKGWQVETVWESKHLPGVINAVTADADSIYGVSKRVLTCIDAATGELRWASERDMFPVRVGDVLLALEDRTGHLCAVRAQAKAYEELARIPVYEVSGGTRVESPLAFADGVLFIRTDFSLVAVRVSSG